MDKFVKLVEQEITNKRDEDFLNEIVEEIMLESGGMTEDELYSENEDLLEEDGKCPMCDESDADYEEELDESDMNVSQRRKVGRTLSRPASRMKAQRTRKRKERRALTVDEIAQKARRKAQIYVKNKFTQGEGIASKKRGEKIAANKEELINRVAKRFERALKKGRGHDKGQVSLTTPEGREKESQKLKDNKKDMDKAKKLAKKEVKKGKVKESEVVSIDDIDIDEIMFEDLYYMYSDSSDNFADEEDFFNEMCEMVEDEMDDDVELTETFSLVQRKKKSRLMKRLAKTSKVKKARERNFRKGKTFKEWMARGKKAFRRFFKNRLLQKRLGKTKETATAKDLNKVEAILSDKNFQKRFGWKVRGFAKELKAKEKAKKSAK